MLPEKLYRNKVLVELEPAPHGATDLSGDVGAVGRLVVQPVADAGAGLWGWLVWGFAVEGPGRGCFHNRLRFLARPVSPSLASWFLPPKPLNPQTPAQPQQQQRALSSSPQHPPNSSSSSSRRSNASSWISRVCSTARRCCRWLGPPWWST